MNPGAFDRIVTIMILGQTNNEGSLEQGWSNLYSNIRARINTKSANQAMRAGVAQGEVMVEYLVSTKDAPEIKAGYGLNDGGKLYRIQGAMGTPEYQRGRYTRIFASLIVT